MYRKLIYLISSVFVPVLILTSTAIAADPSLVGFWKFEEADGTLFDQSDNHNDGTPFNGVLYQQAGPEGYALGFDGTDDYIVVGTTGRPADTFSFGGWFKTSATHEIDPESASGTVGVNNQRYAFDPQHGGDSDAGAGLSIGTNGVSVYEHGSGYMPATAVYETDLGDDWNHIMIVYDNKQPTIYLNGSAVRTGLSSPRAIVNSPIQIGGMAYGYFEGSMDEVRIYNRVLSPAEIGKLAARPKAWSPNPPSGAMYSETWVSMSWQAGYFAVSHDVYMGDNFDDVNNGTGDTFRGNQAVDSLYFVAGFTGYAFPDGLVPGTTYYWRIDEVNEADPNSPWKGPVWSFWIPSKKAYEPVPSDGVKFIDPENLTLTWTPGFESVLHTVYFGDDFDTVATATEGDQQGVTTFSPGPLELGKTYFWRVDEFDENQSTHTGNIWSFTTLPDVPITNPNLVGWWKLDEGYGATTIDWSGYGNHGAITNTGGGLGEKGSVWDTDPERGIVLSFNGNDGTGAYVIAGGIPEMTLTNDFTWAFWARQHPDQSTDLAIGGNDLILGNRYSYTGADPLEFIKFTPAKFEFYNNDPDYLMTVDYDDIPSSVWIHHAGVKKGTTLTYYRNGVESGTSTITNTIQANPFYMAGEPAGGGRWHGWLSDVQLYDMALTLDEIKQVMRGDPLLAWDPNPANGSTPYITEATTLSWSPGDNASQHDVYFGTDKDDVANADVSDTTGIYRGRQNAAVYISSDVEWGGGPYYWRIDEYNIDETISKGKIWSFTVTDFILVDDFEAYNVGDNEIWFSWHDGLGAGVQGSPNFVPSNGTGSMIGDDTTNSYTEETIVHPGGNQSMPYWYDNNKQGFSKYSEAKLTLTAPRDWTEEGVAELSLWFYGDPNNSAEPLYVAVSNSGGTPAVKVHNNPAAATLDTWTEWVIPLQFFEDQGIVLTNVDSIAIGLGTQGNITIPGGSGKMYFDDIRLYRPTPAPEPEPEP